MIEDRTIEQARNADMIAFLGRRHGFTFAHQGGAHRCEQHPSLAVKDDRLSWYWHSKGIGGFGALDYMTKIENMPFRDAVQAITGAVQATAPPQQTIVRERTLLLPEKSWFPRNIYDYLCKKRGIDGDVVNTLIQKGILYEDKRGNVVFIGCDEHGKARFASLRGTHGGFRMDCAGSDKRYGFNMAFPHSDQLYIFESPIDAMSRATMENSFKGDCDAWKRRNYISLGGTSDIALPFFLNQHRQVKELVFCLDNDSPGIEASRNLSDKYAGRGFYVRIEPPYGKDFNEDLQAQIAQRQAERRANIRHRDVTI